MSETNARRLEAGIQLADAQPGEEVIIAGISGRFPNSNNVDEFRENLMNKVDLCDDDSRRWVHTHSEIPKLAGKINLTEKFDPGFFGVHSAQAECMDPMVRMSMERAYEAFIDAGICPEEVKGSRTGVFIGSCYSEAEKIIIYDQLKPQTYGFSGCSRSMLAQRISYAFQLIGPSLICDTACSSGMYAFEQAYRSIREGKCDMALVGGANLCYSPYVTLQFARLGVLNMNTGCRPFDENATGYTRSEAIVMVLLQKKKHAKRIYAEVVHCKVNVDGYKEQGITYPSGEVQTSLLRDLYEECKVSPTTVAFVEAHGTGTKVGDPEELNAIDNFFCTGRKNPLLIGSVKGNIGHSEPASGLCSIVKVIYAMETGIIPPNIHCENPKKDINGLETGRIHVITEKTPWPKISNLAALNCFGFGGANSHILLKRHENTKLRPEDHQIRLVCYSGRTEESMQSYRDFFKNRKLDYDSIALFHSAFRKNISNNIYRGFSLISENGELHSSYTHVFDQKELHLFLSGSRLYHIEVLKEMEKFTFFANLINEYKEALKRNQISEDIYKKGTNVVFATVCLHYCLIKMLNSLNIPLVTVASSSLGEFTAAYAAGVLSLDEVILGVKGINKILAESKMMEADLPRKLLQELKEVLPRKVTKKTMVQKPKSNGFDYATAEYFVYNILNPSVVKEYRWDKEALVIGVDFDINQTSVQVHQLIHDKMKLKDMLINLGQLYLLGVDGDWSKLYPAIKWPVKQGTSMLSPLVKWNHDVNLLIPTPEMCTKDPEQHTFINIMNIDSSFYKGHVIDGRTLFPATGYLYHIWELYALIGGVLPENQKICFEKVKFHRATTFSKDGIINLYLVIHVSGHFEVSENNTTVVTGRIFDVDNTDIAYEGKPNDPNLPLLKQKDIYKELKLRGYNYKGHFKALHEVCGNNGLIEWTGNWITFLDNMLQLFIVQKDSRSLYVPTGLDRLVIDAKAHVAEAETLGEQQLIPVELALDGKIARTKHIEIRSMNANAILRKKTTYSPVLETYKFIPNDIQVGIEDSLRINVHIVLENKSSMHVKVVEKFDENSSKLQPLSEHVLNILGDLPLIQPDLHIVTDRSVDEIKGIQVSENFPDQNNSQIYIGSNLMGDAQCIQEALTRILDDGYIISIDDTAASAPEGLTILTKHQLPSGEYVHLLKKSGKQVERFCLKVIDDFGSWIPTLQSHINSGKNVLLYSENDQTNGILGLVNCLRREANGKNISCVFVQEGNGFDLENDFFKTQLEKGMAINVLRGNIWGTYRHVLLNEESKTDSNNCDHYYAKIMTLGDLSSPWRWVQGPHTKQDLLKNNNLIQVSYSAINFRDVMVASGKVPVDAVTTKRVAQDRILGFEFSGKRLSGERVMSLLTGGAISNLVECDPNLTWRVPDDWSLEEAATVPVVYVTVIVAMKLKGKVKRGDSILIHSGTGGVGQAAINYAHYWGCDIFVTVGTKEKREFLLKHYPFIKESHIGNSRDTTYEQMVLKETQGRGVDLVLNSLAEEKLAASVRCLAQGGRFLEIGKFDLASNNQLALNLMAKGCTFHGIMLDVMMNNPGNLQSEIYNDMVFGLKAGFIKPLIRTVFKKSQLAESFKFMSTGKHMGKVLIKIQDDEDTIEKNFIFSRFYCEPNGSYIILGGLGGFGLELADWLVLRGAKTLILSSRNGVCTGYQSHRIKVWKSYGVKVIIALDDIATYEGCETLMRRAEDVAPVRAFFNLAVVLKDAVFDNQTVDNFKISMSPKATATKHFDKITRGSKSLKHFVVFSSVSCGRGNAGQSNYGMSNSVMERVCEMRRKDGFPAVAIQWGAVGDVGLVADMQKDQSEIAIGGTLQQRISNCLDVMDGFLYHDEAIVSSMVVAEKSGSGNADNLVDAVIDIIGLRDLKTISLHSTLAELGMDSMMAVEIKQCLEREYDIFLSAQDMRSLTFAKLIEMNDTKSASVIVNEANIFDSFGMLLDKFLDVENMNVPLIQYKDAMESDDFIIVFPGVESTYMGMRVINNNMEKPSICVQYTSQIDITDVDVLVDKILQDFGDKITKAKNFKFVAHSFGSMVALKLAHRLEALGQVGKIVLIDGSPELMDHFFKLLCATSDNQLETAVILSLMPMFTTQETIAKLSESILAAKDYQARQELAASAIPKDSPITKEVAFKMGQLILNIVKSILNYKNFQDKLKSEVVLFKPTVAIINDIAEDYNLNALCENTVRIVTFDGDHRTILSNSSMHKELNNIF
ncbi:PREDICTED: fatty acid synthase-like [Nicrophorus vespilloides]|uniref:Fatty acid synthase-like n=1 Tax=Nicrophorus vespilloides TaxID=110193 RepID=A0ABM1M5T6_NICVS|nr:PREDICTED: fatty acid synthase-like [Nicrophorus vespilloides]